ncbi:MAG: dihydroneopterin triphosphate diphosphatase [Betaproteobacteria bacterium]|nr:dihydroneopterin triphosphate diphosphatase [Betaproteobacteria bacterium]
MNEAPTAHAHADAPYKEPVSVLVVIHTPSLDVLLLERADHPGYWQSVTGSRNPGEPLYDTAVREVYEETGLSPGQYVLTDCGQETVYEIYAEWRHRYHPGVTHNTEHLFQLVVPEPLPVKVSPAEHLAYVWVPRERARQMVFSPSNAAALGRLSPAGRHGA